MTYFYKNELYLIEEYQKRTSSISKKLKAITNSNHVQSITPKKTPNKFVDTDFPSLKSVTKMPTNNTRYMSSALNCKRALLKNVITPAKNKEYQIVVVITITYNNDWTISPILSRFEIHNNYNRGQCNCKFHHLKCLLWTKWIWIVLPSKRF